VLRNYTLLDKHKQCNPSPEKSEGVIFFLKNPPCSWQGDHVKHMCKTNDTCNTCTHTVRTWSGCDWRFRLVVELLLYLWASHQIEWWALRYRSISTTNQKMSQCQVSLWCCLISPFSLAVVVLVVYPFYNLLHFRVRTSCIYMYIHALYIIHNIVCSIYIYICIHSRQTKSIDQPATANISSAETDT